MRNAAIDNHLMQALLTTSGSIGISTTVCDGPRLFSTHITRYPASTSPQSSTAAVVFLGMLKKKKTKKKKPCFSGVLTSFKLTEAVVQCSGCCSLWCYSGSRAG